MEIAYDEAAMADIIFWKNEGSTQMLKKISQLLLSIENSPFSGIGKPEQLKYDLAGK